MRSVHLSIAAVVSCLAGLHCTTETIDTVTVEPTATAEPQQISKPTPPEPRDNTPVGDKRDTLFGYRDGRTVTSTYRADDGSFFSAGTFNGTVRIGDVTLNSKGDADIFIEKTNADGTQAWVRSVGSAGVESGANVKNVSDDGTVTLLGMTNGRLDCGSGPLTQWSGETFFVCMFASNGGDVVGAGTFPTGAH